MPEHEMKIELLDPNELKPYDKNPRLNDEAVEAVANSIREFGFRSPIIVDNDRVIIAGHTRYKAALRLGLKEVPVLVADNLTPEQVRAYRIADNKTAEIAQWDYDLLPLELKELQDADFDLSLLGFDPDELDRLLNGPEEDALTAGETEPDAVPGIPETGDSMRGRIYRLGDHLLMCGDATNADDVTALMDGATADLWLTDPPYNVGYTNSLGQTIENDDLEDGQFRAFLNGSFNNAVEVMKPGAGYYIFHADTEGYNFRGACRDAGLKVRECLVWVKNALVLGRCDYHFRHEPCLYGWKDGAAHNWYSDRCQTTVLEFHKPTQNIGHPTAKPVEMLVYLIKNSSRRGEIVIDTFGGSGSTLIACEQTGRVCRMMELDEKYCDVIRRRWAEFKFGEGCDWIEKTPPVEPKVELEVE
jgi:site-specific DNA-methyltransferase (adenine-specific)